MKIGEKNVFYMTHLVFCGTLGNLTAADGYIFIHESVSIAIVCGLLGFMAVTNKIHSKNKLLLFNQDMIGSWLLIRFY